MKKWLIGCGSVFGAFILLGACVAIFSGGELETPTEQTEADKGGGEKKDPAPEPKKDNEVTMEEYNKIENGMSYKEVVKIIGFEGTENAQNEVGGIKTKIYTWQNADGSNMNVTFQNDKVMQKAQFGLK